MKTANITANVYSSETNGEPLLEGVWKFPAIPDNISLNSYDDDTDVDSTLGTPLPDSDISFFDPLSEKSEEAGTLSTSKSWIMEAVNTCARTDRYSLYRTVLI